MRLSLKHLLPSSLFGRSLLIMATPLLLTLAITTFVFFDRHWSTTTDLLSASFAGEINVIADTIDRQDGVLNLAQQRDFEKSFGMQIEHDPRHSFAQAKNRMKGLPGLENSVKDSLRDRLQRPFNITLGKQNKDNVRIIVALKQGVLGIEVSRKRLFSTTTYIFLLWMIGAAFILLWIALLFMRNQVRPIRKLAFAAEQFGKGHDTTWFRPGGAREVRQAADAFVLMRERIRRQMHQRTDMLAGVSHDLRTPLTRMNLQLAMMPDNADSATLRHDIQIMQQMIDEYLAFARGASQENASYADIREQLQQAVHDAQRLGLQIAYIPPDEPVLLKIRPQALQRVFTNILQNALIYARVSESDIPQVVIALHQTANSLAIQFDDNGPGIPADKHEDVFRPFIRLETSRNSETGGVGLGLSIARDIIQSHGGEIMLSPSPQGGLRVEITLPL